MLQMHFDLLCFPPPPPPPPPSPLIVLPQQFQAKSRTLLMPTNNSNSKVSFLMSESPERKIKSTFKVCRQPVGLRRNMAEKGYIRRVECFFFCFISNSNSYNSNNNKTRWVFCAKVLACRLRYPDAFMWEDFRRVGRRRRRRRLWRETILTRFE